MDVNQTWMTFACQYRNDGWEDRDLLYQGENVKWEAGTKKTMATKQNTNTLGDDLVCGLHIVDTSFSGSSAYPDSTLWVSIFLSCFQTK